MSDQPKLKPCPFCGHKAAFRDGEGNEAGGIYIQCVNMSCLSSSCIMWPEMDDVKPLLAEKWNRRTTGHFIEVDGVPQ